MIGLLSFVLALAVVVSGGQQAGDAAKLEGSFELESGTVVTGGRFVERAGGGEVFLFMDTEKLETGGVFIRDGAASFVSVVPPDGQIRIALAETKPGEPDAIVWKEEGRPALRGRRVHPHVEQTIRFESKDGTALDGRLLVPDGPGPHPLVVVVSGSGPATRYGGPFETFFVQLGMAVLSYDKRGVGQPEWREPDFASLAEDAATAVRFGRSHPSIDESRVGIFASSQGGWIAPIAASLAPVDFMIVRVGPGVSNRDSYVHEVRQELRADGLGGLDLDKATALLREALDLAIAKRPIAEADALARPWLDEPWYRKAFGKGPISEIWSQRWWEWIGRNMAIEPAPYLQKYPGPVLWFLAEEDENVPLVASYAALRPAIGERTDGARALVIVPDVAHSFLYRDEAGRQRYTPHFWTTMKRWLEARELTG